MTILRRFPAEFAWPGGTEVESSASPPGLPGNGLEMLVKTAVQRGFWRERQGLVAKKWERVTTD